MTPAIWVLETEAQKWLVICLTLFSEGTRQWFWSSQLQAAVAQESLRFPASRIHHLQESNKKPDHENTECPDLERLTLLGPGTEREHLHRDSLGTTGPTPKGVVCRKKSLASMGNGQTAPMPVVEQVSLRLPYQAKVFGSCLVRAMGSHAEILTHMGEHLGLVCS